MRSSFRGCSNSAYPAAVVAAASIPRCQRCGRRADPVPSGWEWGGVAFRGHPPDCTASDELSGTPLIDQFLRWYFDLEPGLTPAGVSWLARDTVSGRFWIVLLILFAIGIVGLAYCRETRHLRRPMPIVLLSLRVVASLLLLLMLSGLGLQLTRTGLPTLIVMVDTSASMDLRDAYSAEQRQALRPHLTAADKVSRLELVQSVLTEPQNGLLAALAERYRIALYEFRETAIPLAQPSTPPRNASGEEDPVTGLTNAVRQFQADGLATRPRQSIEKVFEDFRGSRPAAMVVWTDGVATESNEDRLSRIAEAARRREIPLFPIGTGRGAAERDLAILDVAVDRIAFVDDPLAFRARVQTTGGLGGRGQVILRRSNDDRALVTEEMALPEGDGVESIELVYVPREAGEQEFTIEVIPLSGEADVGNNSTVVSVSVRDDPLRVLLVERTPRWEFRHLKAELERDQTLDVDTYLHSADLEYAREDRTALPRLPRDDEALDGYDVVIWGDLDPDQVSNEFMARLRTHVAEDGGGVLFIAGPRHLPSSYLSTPFLELFPVELAADGTIPVTFDGGARVMRTVEGRVDPLTGASGAGPTRLWQDPPPVYSCVTVERSKAGAQTLVEARGDRSAVRRPLIVRQRFGAGQVVMHLTDELWRWRSVDEGAAYRQYWRQAIRQLGKGKRAGAIARVELVTDRASYPPGAPVVLRVRSSDEMLWSGRDELPVLISGPSNSSETVVLKRGKDGFEATFHPKRTGPYAAHLSFPEDPGTSLSASWQVIEMDREREVTQIDRQDLIRAAESSGGAYFDVWNAGSVIGELPRGETSSLTRSETLPLWNRWELIGLFCAVLFTEWVLRKQLRLV